MISAVEPDMVYGSDRERVLEYMVGRIVSVREIANSYGWSRHKSRRLLERLHEAGRVHKGGPSNEREYSLTRNLL